MEVGEDEDFGRVLRRQVGAERLLAHDFEPLQGVLVGGGQQVVGHALQVARLARVDEAQHLAEDVVVHVRDLDAVVLALLHLVFEHGREDGTARRQDRLVGLELAPVDAERDVAEALVLEHEAQILGQSALWNFELDGVGLAGNVDAVGHDADLHGPRNRQLPMPRTNESRSPTYLAEQGQLVVGQETVGFVEQEVAADELFKAPVLALDESVGSLALCNAKRGR